VLLAGARDSSAASGAALVLATLLMAPLALATGGVESGALPYIAASSALELVYFALLARAYGEGELSVVYPVARGSAPVLVLAIGTVALGADPSALEAAGVALVAVGVLMVRRPADGAVEPWRDVAFGLAIGLCIAGYTLVDFEGLDHARPLAYLELTLLPTATVYCAVLVATGGGEDLRAAIGPRAALTGALVFGAYAMVLGALELAPAAPVAAVRESSVVIAALMAAVFLHERVSPARLAGAAIVATGVAAVAIG
jgi:drug/metabolite transporter (DMT)-like permease